MIEKVGVNPSEVMPGVEVQAPVALPIVEPAPLPPRCQVCN